MFRALTALVLVAGCTASDPESPDPGTGSSSGAGGVAGSLSSGGSAPSGGAGASAVGGANAGGAASVGGSAGAFGTAGGAAGQASGGASGNGGASGSGGTAPATASGLPVPPGAGNAPKPAGAQGGLDVLDWAGFKAAVSYTFDDSNSTQISHYAELNALGVRFTFYLQTGTPESTNAIWQTAVADGHELGNHSKSHSPPATAQDIDDATAFIEDTFGVKVWTMAAPNGSPTYAPFAEDRFLINRGVSPGLIGPNDDSDPYDLYCSLPLENAQTSALNADVDSARSAGKWRVMLVHGFTGGNDNPFQPVAFDQFAASVTYAKSLGDLWIDSVVNVGAYWRGQKAFSAATPQTSGSDTTWTWTLPEHFPPGKYLRVTVTGGTPKQNGTPLTWDPHGFYEVALDAESLTLSP